VIVRLAPRARRQIRSAAAFLLEENPTAAAGLSERVKRALRLLERFPEAGRRVLEYPEHDLREVLVRPYRLIYEIDLDEVRVLSFFHWSRDLPEEPPLQPEPGR
jgi:plasmid stabilization system protein ParE